MEQRITIRSYPKTWAIENRIYAMMNMRLPRPVEPRLFLYYAGTLLLVNSRRPHPPEKLYVNAQKEKEISEKEEHTND